MTLPTTNRKLSITLDSNGLWRRKRFEFCNALEDVCGGDAKAWDGLAEMGVTSDCASPQIDVIEPSDTAQTDTRKP